MSREAEQSLIGALLLDSAASDAIPEIRASHFQDGRHRRIMSAIMSHVAQGRPADPITIQADLGGGDDLLAYLTAMAQAVPSARHAKRYAEIVIESAAQRDIRELAEQIAEVAAEEGASRDKIDKIGALMSKMRPGTKRVPMRIGELALKRTEHYEAIQAGTLAPGWPTQIAGMDRRLGGGLKPGWLYILAARPSVGKTSFAMQLSRRLAWDGLPGLFLSQEMEAGAIVDRAVSSEACINGLAMATGQMTDEDWGRAVDALGNMAGLPLWIDDQPAQTLMDMRSKARGIPGLKFVVVDYLQLCNSSLKRESRSAQVGEISRGLKELAKELGIAVIALSQLNREVEKRPGQRPTMADLRDSGEIEQDADAVLLLWPLLLAKDSQDSCARIGYDLAKVRGGITGDGVLRFDGSIQRWAESIERVSDFGKKTTGYQDL